MLQFLPFLLSREIIARNYVRHFRLRIQRVMNLKEQNALMRLSKEMKKYQIWNIAIGFLLLGNWKLVLMMKRSFR